MKRAMEDQLKRKEEDEKIAKEDEHKLFCYNEYHRRYAKFSFIVFLERRRIVKNCEEDRNEINRSVYDRHFDSITRLGHSFVFSLLASKQISNRVGNID